MKNYDAWNYETNQWYTPDHFAKPTYAGNTQGIIDWDSVLLHLKDLPGIKLPPTGWTNPLFEPMDKLFKDSNYSNFSAEWINYYPGKDYDEAVDLIFGELVKHPKCVRAWISKINPGHTAPWHWDLDDNETEYLKAGKLIRFVCKASVPAIGHVAVIGNHALYGGLQGDTYIWTDTHCWHGSVNCGLVPKYQYNYLAYL